MCEIPQKDQIWPKAREVLASMGNEGYQVILGISQN